MTALMQRLALGAVFAACSSSTGPDPERATPVGTVEADAGDSSNCRAAQRAEVDAWVAEMVTDTDDDLEMWTALGMVMTLTEPEVLAEMRDTMPEAATAIAMSERAWAACSNVVRVNCAALDRALDVTEARVSETVWDRRAVEASCMAGKVNVDAADCALAATDVPTAKACFDDES